MHSINKLVARSEIEAKFKPCNKTYKKKRKLLNIDDFLDSLISTESLPYLKLFVFYIDQCSIDNLISRKNIDFCSFQKFANVNEFLFYLDQIFNNIRINHDENLLGQNIKFLKNFKI